MEGFLIDAPYVAAMLGVTLGITTFGLGALRNLWIRREFYVFARTETDESLDAASRVLTHGSTPAEIRTALLFMLQALAKPSVGRSFTEHYFSLQTSAELEPVSNTSLADAMDKLHAKNPKLAADAHKALMGLILAVPLINADKVDITEIRGLKYLGEGATNPNAVFGRASSALAMGDGLATGSLAAA